MPPNRAFRVALAWAAALAAGCGGLADGDYGGEPLAWIRGTLIETGAVERAGEAAFALVWAPASDHESALNLLGGPAGPAPAGSRTESCRDVVPPTEPLCDGTAARGDRVCEWTDRRLGSLVRVVDYRAHLPAGFEIPVRELPPGAARYDLSRQGGFGSFALASAVLFDDVNRDGAFRLGTRDDPPEPTLASSGRQGYDPGPSRPRRSYLIAYLDGLIDPARIDPALAEVLLFLPQGFSMWVEEEWIDGHGRTASTGRFWQPIDVPIELFMPAQAAAGCQGGIRETVHLPAIPEGEVPLWCSDDRFRATWSRTRANGCVTVEERYSGDFSCAAPLPPAWACPSPTNGSLVVSVTTTGQDVDPDGYAVRVDGGAPHGVEANASLVMPVMFQGNHTVTIEGLAANCAVAGAASATVSVVAGETAQLAFAVECQATGAIRVSIIPVDSGLDFGGFAVSIDGGAPAAIALNDWEIFSGLRPGAHALSLSWDATTCLVNTQNPLEVEVPPGATVEAAFTVTCGRRGDFRVTATTTGFDLDADGYVATWAGVRQPIAANGSVLFQGAWVGSNLVFLDGLARNCSVSGPNPQFVSVVFGQTASVAFAVDCVATGSLAVTAATTGVDLDPDGYRVTWSGAGGAETVALPLNGTTAITGLVPGVYQLTFGGTAPNCDAPRTATATVVAGAATAVTFDVACSPFGSLVVTATTTGVDVDPDGYSVAWSGAGQGGTVAVPANGTAVIAGLVAGVYQLTLGGMAPNCDGLRAVTATVVWGAVTPVAFDVGCAPDRGLAFQSSVEGNADVYFIHSNGAGLQRLTVHPANDADPAWSPDGARIALVSDRDGNPEIYVMEADGSNPTRLTNEPDPDRSPAWSPDGSQIAFERWNSRQFVSRIWFMNADGSAARALPASYDDLGNDRGPAWSPDGTRIAFVTDNWGCSFEGCSNHFGLGVRNVDGTGVRWLVVDGSGCTWFGNPDWSPDGRHLAYAVTWWDCMGGTDWAETRTQIVRADGTDLIDLASGVTPAWRP